jgi:LmbE family N-acetylglucosaminyl deacetylase
MRLGDRVVVLSPHLDDAVFSVGAAIAGAARRGAEVAIVTVFADDPESGAPAAPWDAACGFATEGEAARARRDEDRRACALVGAAPVWLPFRDEEYGRDAPEEEIREALDAECEGADTVLVPGFPLAHPDHAWLTRLVLRRGLSPPRTGLYVEQPYASWQILGRGRRTWAVPGLTLSRALGTSMRLLLRRPSGRALQAPSRPAELPSGEARLDWLRLSASPADWWSKQRAMRAYASQLRGFGPLVAERIALYEFGWGGEGLAWLSS